jgi:hypothetical protein
MADYRRYEALEGIDLAAALLLYEGDYGAMTFAFELKAPAASVLVAWGKQGLTGLVQAAKRNPTHSNLTFCVQELATVAAGGVLPDLSFIRDASYFPAQKSSVCSSRSLTLK